MRKSRRVLVASILLALSLTASSCFAGNDAISPRGKRPAAVAGSFYPGDAAQLKSDVNEYLAAGEATAQGRRVIALVAPHAGYQFSGGVAGKAYSRVKGATYGRVIVLGVNHYGGAAPVSVDNVSAYVVPGGEVEVDMKALDVLMKAGIPAAGAETSREHSIEVQIPFLIEALEPGWKLVPILMGGASGEDCRKAAEVVRSMLDAGTLVVVSTDFTHYGERFGYMPFEGSDAEVEKAIRKLDKGAVDRVLAVDAPGFHDYCAKSGATICGKGGLLVLLQLLKGEAVGENIAYKTSGGMTGDFEMSVSYVALAFTVAADSDDPRATVREGENAMSPEQSGLTRQEKATLLKVARDTLQEVVYSHKRPDFSGLELTDSVKEKRGAFVTLSKDGMLRGCIGYVEPIEPLWKAVQDNTVNAALNDPRFDAVGDWEVKNVHIEISAMSPLQEITDPELIEVGKHGIILSRGGRKGLLLPQVATEYGWDREEFLVHTCRKAGLADDAWKDPATKIEIFSAEVFGEGEGVEKAK